MCVVYIAISWTNAHSPHVSGNFAIKPDKKSEAKIAKATKVGMIAGGTGK